MGDDRSQLEVQGWVAAVIMLSLMVAPLLVHGVSSLWFENETVTSDGTDGGPLRYLPLVCVTLFLHLCLASRGRISRWVRASLLLVPLHLATIAAAWVLWQTYTPNSDYIEQIVREDLPFVDAFPFGVVVASAGAAVLVSAVAWTIARPRTIPNWLQGLVTALLLHVLLLGLWLPMMCAIEPDIAESSRAYHSCTRRPGFVGGMMLALLPPTAAAAAFTVVVYRGRQTLSHSWGAIGWVVGLLFVISAAIRVGTGIEAGLTYANLLPILLAETAVAAIAVLALALVHWRSLAVVRDDAGRSAPWKQIGVIDGPSGTPVGWLRFPSWLHGLRAEVSSFELRTRDGVLRVPASARLVVPIPHATTRLAAGGEHAVLHAGDRVVVTGFVDPPGDGPYRGSALPVPGDDGLVVTLESAPELSWRDTMLVMWRPCVLYLLAATTAGALAVAGLASL